MEKTQGPKVVAIKLLAIVGFFAMGAIVVWVLVQGVRIFPDTFSSLATIAESVSTYQAERELVMMVFSVYRIIAHVMQRVIHPAHVPFDAESQSSGVGWPGDATPRG